MNKIETIEEVETRHIKKVMLQLGGNMSQAAKALGIDRRTIYRKVNSYTKKDLSAESSVEELPKTFEDLEIRISNLEFRNSNLVAVNDHLRQEYAKQTRYLERLKDLLREANEQIFELGKQLGEPEEEFTPYQIEPKWDEVPTPTFLSEIL